MIGYHVVSANEKVDEIKDMMVEQIEKEVYLTPYGYTLDNPNIILDPYGISPLTAMILFETKEPEEVTITVKGKDQDSTYTNTFKKDTKHNIPIYGLYPNTINEVTIQCGTTNKTYQIETSPLPTDFITEEIENNTNNLIFLSSNNYIYALDNHNEVRWYLTKNTSKELAKLNSGNLLLELSDLENTSTNLVEIDLLGKIHKQYNLEIDYQGSFLETETSLFILSKELLEIDKQSGTILNEIPLNDTYNNLSYDPENENMILSNDMKSIALDLNTKKITPLDQIYPKKDTNLIMPLYQSNQNYKLTQGVKFNHTNETEESDQNIFLIGYKEMDEFYQQHHIKLLKTSDNLQITGTFQSDEKVYLILDQFLDKRIYDIKSDHTTINKKGLSGKYSIYIKINNTIYKTNTYVTF